MIISTLTPYRIYLIYVIIMDSTLSSKLRSSLIQLIIGLILLLLAYWYLKWHPAERQSIKSSISTAHQKINKIFGHTSKEDTLIMEQQTQALTSLKEIITTIQTCNPQTSINEYQALYSKIEWGNIEDFARNGSKYYNQMSEAYQKMQELCKKS